jgi:hypothetical protein
MNIEGDWERVNRAGTDEPFGVVVHICMGTTQEMSFISN